MRDPGAADDNEPDLLDADGVAALGALIGPQWGVFLDGFPVIVAESCVAFDYKQTASISNYPVERGAFESYNKVRVPYDARVRFGSGGSAAARQALLSSIAAVINDLNLYDVVTPDAIYQSANLIAYSYRQTHREGVGLLLVDVLLEQVRVTTDADFTQTQSPSGASPVSGGNVQTQTPTAAQTTAAGGIT